MKKEVKSPPVCFTQAEVLLFNRNKNRSIPEPHHINMVHFKGCSRKTFVSYIAHMHHLSEDALTLMCQSPDCQEALELWLKYNKHSISEKHLSILYKRFGAEWVLEHKIFLSEKYTIDLLRNNQDELIIAHLDQLLFGAHEEALLLGKNNLKLTEAYLKGKGCILPENSEIFLGYDCPEIYRTYFVRGSCCKEVRMGLITKKSVALFALMCEYTDLPLPEQIALVDTGDLEKLRIFAKKYILHEKTHLYIAEHAPDPVFAFAITENILNATPADVLYERLFRPSNRELLSHFLHHFPLEIPKWEIKLLTSDDQTLISLYTRLNSLSSAAKSYLLTHGFKEKFHISEQDLDFLDWETESYLFKYGTPEQIKTCLFAEGDIPTLSDLGEAMLFRYAPSDIVAQYIRDTSEPLQKLSQRALILRNDTELLNIFMKYDDFEDELRPLLIQTADTTLLLEYLIEHMSAEILTSYEQDVAAKALCQRKDKLLIAHALKNYCFGADAEIALVQNAPDECISAYFAEKALYPIAEEALLRSGKKQLISEYIFRYAVAPENEVLILNLMDEEIISTYEVKHSFKSDDACEYLAF